MNQNYLCVFDFETGSANPHKCQPTQLAAIMINPRTLTVEPGGIFNSEICPILDDEKAVAAGLDPLEQEALDITRKTREGLALAPSEKIVLSKFHQFMKKFTKGGSNYNAPVPCGYNINHFDIPIVNRLANQYGYIKKEKQDLFNNMWNIDLMQMCFTWTENNIDMKNRKLTSIMDWLGFPSELKDNAHDALQDVKNTANVLIKLLSFQRDIASKTEFNKAFANGKMYVE